MYAAEDIVCVYVCLCMCIYIYIYIHRVAHEMSYH